MKKQISVIFVLLLLVLTSYSQIPQNGLVGWWPFNGNANDESGNNNHGLVGGATLTYDRYGNPNTAYRFDEDYILIPNDNVFDFVNVTISLWIKTTSYGLESIMKQGNYDDAENELFSIHHSASFFDGELNYRSNIYFAGKYNNLNCLPGVGWNYTEDDSIFLNTNQTISDGSWHNLICTINQNVLKLYVDGTLWSERIADGSELSHCYGGDIQIGRDWSMFHHYYHGEIDDIGFWNRALDEKEIKDIFSLNPESPTSVYNTPNPTDFGGKVECYPNPTTDVINVDLSDLNKYSGQKLKIMNFSGQIVYEENINQSKIVIDVKSILTSGIYVLNTVDQNGNVTSTNKFVVQ